MSDFLTDTLVWTGALLAFVLLVRRPVAQLFGPKAAYALWALPMARLLLPPIVLPAWMAPAAEPAAAPITETAVAFVADEVAVAPLASASHSFASAPNPAEPTLLDTLAAVDWSTYLLPLWLAGAAVFLIRRYALYFQMRRELLAAARPVGEAGKVRLVETPAADGPVAFGVIDKVVALPMGFMAGHDRAARDLALAHELAHHRGHDLACNMLVQPLFALHWFNPLSLLGWRALRRDQEAACDARVIASESRERRAAYAAVIARFAVQPKHAARLALAAPMACPVLGDRSIVQRLKSLTMSDISARRRWSGRVMIAAAALALPLTGSISYAQDEVPAAPPAPPAPPAPVAAVPPVAPPAPPAPPEVVISDDGKHRIVRIEKRIVRDGAEARKHPVERRIERRIFKKDGKLYENGREMSAEERAEFERDMAEHKRDMEEHARDIEEQARDRAEYSRDMAEHAREMAELQRELRRERIEIDREVRASIAEAQAGMRIAAQAVAHAPSVVNRCREGQKQVTETVIARGGKQTIYVCNEIAFNQARREIALARADVARSKDMAEIERVRTLQALDAAERGLRAN